MRKPLRIFYADSRIRSRKGERNQWIESVQDRIDKFSATNGNCVSLKMLVEPESSDEYAHIDVCDHDFFILHKGNTGRGFQSIFNKVQSSQKPFILFGGGVSEDDQKAYGEDHCHMVLHEGPCRWFIEEFLEDWKENGNPNPRILMGGRVQLAKEAVEELRYDVLQPFIAAALSQKAATEIEFLRGKRKECAALVAQLIDPKKPSTNEYILRIKQHLHNQPGGLWDVRALTCVLSETEIAPEKINSANKCFDQLAAMLDASASRTESDGP